MRPENLPNDVQDALRNTVRKILIDIAGDEDTISYSALSIRVGPIEQNNNRMIHYRFWDTILGQISSNTNRIHNIFLSALVVRVDTKRPGAGFFAMFPELSDDITDQIAFWENQRRKVFEHYQIS